MIETIGIKRILILGFLAVLLVSLVVLNYYVILPQKEQSARELSEVLNEASGLQSEVDKMRADMALFEKQRVFFDTISRAGFFNAQDRVLARERFDAMQKMSKIIAARYEIRPATVQEEENAAATGYTILQSPITVSLSAVDDLDVYRFIYYLNYGFPGHITINSLDIERKAEVTPDLLKEIGMGMPPEIISAKMELDWRTMTRKEDISSMDPSALDSAGGRQ